MKLNVLLLLRRWQFYVVLLVCLFCLVLVLTSNTGVTPALTFFILAVVYFLFYILRNSLAPKNKNLFLPATYVFNNKEVVITTPVSHRTIRWNVFLKWKQISGFYLIWVSRSGYLIIPKASIAPELVPALESLLQKKIKTKDDVSVILNESETAP